MAEVKYDIEKCRQWFAHVKEKYTKEEFAFIWCFLSFNVFDFFDYVIESSEERSFKSEWLKLSLWERQAILYMFVPEIERIAKEQAHKLCQEAREKEPLC